MDLKNSIFFTEAVEPHLEPFQVTGSPKGLSRLRIRLLQSKEDWSHKGKITAEVDNHLGLKDYQELKEDSPTINDDDHTGYKAVEDEKNASPDNHYITLPGISPGTLNGTTPGTASGTGTRRSGISKDVSLPSFLSFRTLPSLDAALAEHLCENGYDSLERCKLRLRVNIILLLIVSAIWMILLIFSRFSQGSLIQLMQEPTVISQPLPVR